MFAQCMFCTKEEYRLQSTQVVETTTLDSFLDVMAVFVKWMDGVEELLAAEKIVMNETDIVEQQLQQLLVHFFVLINLEIRF